MHERSNLNAAGLRRSAKILMNFLLILLRGKLGIRDKITYDYYIDTWNKFRMSQNGFCISFPSNCLITFYACKINARI